MEKSKEKIVLFLKTLKNLEIGIELFYQYKNLCHTEPTEENKLLCRAMRDATCLRFKCCIDLFWKVSKIYLEDAGNIGLIMDSPRSIIRDAVTAKLFSEEEGRKLMDMVKIRNKTSHAYHEIVAEEIADEIPRYYDLMEEIADRLHKTI